MRREATGDDDALPPVRRRRPGHRAAGVDPATVEPHDQASGPHAPGPTDAFSPEVARALRIAAEARARSERIRSQSFEARPWTPRRVRAPEPRQRQTAPAPPPEAPGEQWREASDTAPAPAPAARRATARDEPAAPARQEDDHGPQDAWPAMPPAAWRGFGAASKSGHEAEPLPLRKARAALEREVEEAAADAPAVEAGEAHLAEAEVVFRPAAKAAVEPQTLAGLEEALDEWRPAAEPAGPRLEAAREPEPRPDPAGGAAHAPEPPRREAHGASSRARFSRTVAAAQEDRVAQDSTVAWSHTPRTDEAIGLVDGSRLGRLLRRLTRRAPPAPSPAPEPPAPAAAPRTVPRVSAPPRATAPRETDAPVPAAASAAAPRRPFHTRRNGSSGLIVAFCIVALITSALFGGLLGFLTPDVLDRVRSWFDQVQSVLTAERPMAAKTPADVAIAGLPQLAASGDVTARFAATPGGKPVEALPGRGLETVRIRPAAYAPDDHQAALDAALKAAKRVPALAGMAATVEADPSRADALHDLGRGLQRLGRLDAAAAMYRQVVALEADHVYARYNLGVLLERHGDVEEALVHHRRAAGLAPDNALIHYDLARLLERAGDLEAAVRSYERVRGLAPANTQPGRDARARLRELTAHSG